PLGNDERADWIAFSRDGKVAFSLDRSGGVLSILDVDARKRRAAIDDVATATVSPEGDFIALGRVKTHLEDGCTKIDQSTIDIANAATGAVHKSMPVVAKPRRPKGEHDELQISVAFSSKGKSLVIGECSADEEGESVSSVRVLDTTSWKEIGRVGDVGRD